MGAKGTRHRQAVKVRSFKYKARGETRVGYAVSLVPALAERVPPGSRFVAELVGDGILFRLVKQKVATPDPAWVKEPS